MRDGRPLASVAPWSAGTLAVVLAPTKFMFVCAGFQLLVRVRVSAGRWAPELTRKAHAMRGLPAIPPGWEFAESAGGPTNQPFPPEGTWRLGQAQAARTQGYVSAWRAPA